MDRDRRTTWLRRLRRILRRAGLVVGGIVAVILLAVLSVLLLAPGRRAILDKGLELAAGALPGELTVAGADWPGLGCLQLDGVVWTDGPDTLARVDTLRLHVDVSDLMARDVTIRRVLAAGIAADVPAIMERMPTAAPDTTLEDAPAGPAETTSFPRAGALPPLPSVAVENLAIRRVVVTSAPEQIVQLDSLTLAVDLRHGRTPKIAAALNGRPLPGLGVAWRFAGTGDRDTLTLDLAPLYIESVNELPEPSALPLDGRLRLPMAMLDSLMAGRVPQWPSLDVKGLAIAGETGAWRIDARLDGRRPGRLSIASSLPEAPRTLLTALMDAGADTLAPGLLDSLDARWGRHGDPGMHLRVNLEPPPAPEPLLASRIRIDGDVRLPALATVAPLLPPQLVADDLGPVLAAVDIRYDGQTRPPTFMARLDLGRTDWIDAALIAASGDTTIVRLDSLVVRLPGIALTGAGSVDRDSLRVDLDLEVTDGSLMERWQDPAMDHPVMVDLDPRATIRLDAVSAWPLPPLELPTELDPADPLAMILVAPIRIVLDADVHLPPLSHLGELLPPQLVVDDLGAVHAALDVEYDGLAASPRFRTRIDLGDTDWLDTLHLSARGDTTGVWLDSLLVRMPGLSVDASGAADRDSMRLALAFDLPDSSLLMRWRDPALDGIYPRANVSVTAAGAWPLPQVDLTAELALVSPQVTIPEMTVAAVAATDTVILDVELPQGLATSTQNLESASFHFAGAAADSLRWLRGDFRADLTETRAGVLLAGRVEARDLLAVASGTVTGDTLRIRLAENAIANEKPWQIRFDLADSLVELSDFEMSGNLGRLGLTARATPDSLDAELVLAMELAMDAIAAVLPPATASLLPKGTVTASGDLMVSGPTTAPWAGGRIRVAFADNEDLAGLSLETDLAVGGEGNPPDGIDTGRATWRERSARIDVTLSDADTPLTHISALVPLPHADAGADSVDVRIDATGMDLGRLQPLLPKGTSLTGILDSDTRVAGMMEPGEIDADLVISGGLRITDLRLGAPDGSWISMHGNVDLDGTSLAPVVNGGLDIEGGLIRIPEPPPSLLPTEGEALLWQAAAPAPDSLAVDLAVAVEDSTPSAPPLPGFVPKLTFAIRCPGSLWLRGQGLDVELSGDLALHLRDGRPAIEGELEARQGTMKQLGRVFTLDRGRIIFYADEEELNPELDLALGVRVSSYQITISLTGTANDPTLEFYSSPELSDGDIISVLLFGKTSDELDEGQSGLMAERAGQVALAYGSVKLQESLAKELGVDVLSIAPQSGDSEKSALTVGKYLNTKVMVRYEQVLDEDSAFYVHLDYNLTSNQEWKLHTQVSQGEASGVEIKWEKEW